MKIRVIPTILTDGNTVVKGTEFDNWRTVGNVQAMAKLFSARDVDELMFLDVNATSNGRSISPTLINYFSEVLSIPFSVGGGIDSLEIARECMRSGAEKVVLGSVAIENPTIVKQISDTFGSQAVIVAIDVGTAIPPVIYSHSGKTPHQREACDFARKMVELGAGELLIQSKYHDGHMKGMNLQSISNIVKSVSVPVIASSGVGELEDFKRAIEAGASAVAAGSIFQFTMNTPSEVRQYLKTEGYAIREI
jgi:cyclase